GEAEGPDEGVRGVDRDGDPVVAHEEPGPLDPLGPGFRVLVRRGGAAGVDDVELALEVAAEAAASAVAVDHDLGVLVTGTVRLLGGLADAVDRARPVDHDGAGGRSPRPRAGPA